MKKKKNEKKEWQSFRIKHEIGGLQSELLYMCALAGFCVKATKHEHKKLLKLSAEIQQTPEKKIIITAQNEIAKERAKEKTKRQKKTRSFKILPIAKEQKQTML